MCRFQTAAARILLGLVFFGVVILKLMAKALDLPTAYFYCDDDLLAELMVRFMSLDAEHQQALIESINQPEIR